MLNNISWIIIIFLLLVIKYCILQPIEDKKKYKENEKEDELFNQINKLD